MEAWAGGVKMRRIGAGILLAAAALIVWIVPVAHSDYHSTGNPPGPQTGGTEAQLRTAIQHASELAAGASSLSGIRTHLQHAINCLEGARGKHFKAAGGDPCKGMGNGFLADARGKAGALFLARQANDLAVEAVTTLRDVPTAQAAARSVAFVLGEAMKLLK
jgi:hypothetical protein